MGKVARIDARTTKSVYKLLLDVIFDLCNGIPLAWAVLAVSQAVVQTFINLGADPSDTAARNAVVTNQ